MPRLLRELDRLQQELQVPEDYTWTDSDLMAQVKYGYLQLRKVAELSCQHGLPIIFWA